MQVNTEKERKFLLDKAWRKMADFVKASKTGEKTIKQVHLRVGENEVFAGSTKRVLSRRIYNIIDSTSYIPRYIYSVKSEKFGDGKTCLELEFSITYEKFVELSAERDESKTVILKKRTDFPIKQGDVVFNIEVDMYFDKERYGLIVAEVEGPDCEKFVPPGDWVEVTMDHMFANGNLAGMSRFEVTSAVVKYLNGGGNDYDRQIN